MVAVAIQPELTCRRLSMIVPEKPDLCMRCYRSLFVEDALEDNSTSFTCVNCGEVHYVEYHRKVQPPRIYGYVAYGGIYEALKGKTATRYKTAGNGNKPTNIGGAHFEYACPFDCDKTATFVSVGHWSRQKSVVDYDNYECANKHRLKIFYNGNGDLRWC